MDLDERKRWSVKCKVCDAEMEFIREHPPGSHLYQCPDYCKMVKELRLSQNAGTAHEMEKKDVIIRYDYSGKEK